MRQRDLRSSFYVLVVTFVYSAVGEHCFQNREPSGNLGKCTNLLNSGTTKASCCAAGGVGWTTKANGKRCEDTCAGLTTAVPNAEGGEGGWSDWGDWSLCDVTCGEGISTRSRTCTGGAACAGESVETAVCYEGECPIDGGWSDWSDWTDCPVTCGGDLRVRERECNNPPPQHGGENCTGKARQRQECGTDPCPVHGNWSDWGPWSSCSVTCKEGIMKRRRTCTNPEPAYGGALCQGDRRETAACNEGPCPIRGGWGEFEAAGECSGTCDSDENPVYKDQRRLCNNPQPQHGGEDCKGPALRRIRCRELPKCAIHGGWSAWTQWSDCSQTCGDGVRTRERTCTNPAPQYGGDDCEGDTTETKVCRNPRRCPVHGGWTEWDDWTPCDAPRCGLSGRHMRSRSCTNPSPKRGGSYCQGPIIEREECERLCAYWSEWSDWGPCLGGCTGRGFQKRYRKCHGEGARPSNEDFQEVRDCNICIQDDEDYQVGSGSESGDGSGEGSGDTPDVEVWNPICDDALSCQCDVVVEPSESSKESELSYSDVGPKIGDSSSRPGCEDNFDYSIDYCDETGGAPNPPTEDSGSSAESVDGDLDDGVASDSQESVVDPSDRAGSDYSNSYSFDDAAVVVEVADVPANVPAAAVVPDGGSSDSYSFDDGPAVAAVPANADDPEGGAEEVPAGNDNPAGSSSDYGDNAGVIAGGVDDPVVDDSDSYSY